MNEPLYEYGVRVTTRFGSHIDRGNMTEKEAREYISDTDEIFPSLSWTLVRRRTLSWEVVE